MEYLLHSAWDFPLNFSKILSFVIFILVSLISITLLLLYDNSNGSGDL